MVKEKLHSIINLLLVVFSFLFFLIYQVSTKQFNLLNLGAFVIEIMILPLANKAFNLKLNDNYKTLYIIFIILSSMFGAGLHFYRTNFMFDKIVHFISGILVSLTAIIILYKNFYYKNNIISNFFIIGFTSVSAVVWEILEYVASMITGFDHQNVLTTGVSDTMIDMFMALLGSVIIIVLYNNIKTKKYMSYFIS